MLGPRQIREEHKKAVTEMAKLMREATGKGYAAPIDHDLVLYHRLAIIKDMLEWVHSPLIKRDPNRGEIEQLMGDSKYYGMGPVATELTQRRW